MKPFLLSIAILVSIAAPALSQAPPDPDIRDFEITATLPSTPILKHQLYFEFPDRIPGNAALAYLDAILLIPEGAKEKAEKAIRAYAAKDTASFAKLADGLAPANLLEELDVAARREQCDWMPPMRERGDQALLPHLNPLAHGISKILKVRALRQIQTGNID